MIIILFANLIISNVILAQGTSNIEGKVMDVSNRVLSSVSIIATHTKSGSYYNATSDCNGNFVFLKVNTLGFRPSIGNNNDRNDRIIS